ncbi:hypothetical protein SAZ11_30175 [Streptomyces sp. FXJ1.4098]|nr:hypothetical protein [Streptomyces sp. FXJ1.4098]
MLTDIKIQLLLTGIRSRYDVRQLVVSDALTASRTLERHLTALDFCQRVLRTEVMTGLAELARFLGSRPDDDRRLTRGGAGTRSSPATPRTSRTSRASSRTRTPGCATTASRPPNASDRPSAPSASPLSSCWASAPVCC